jgi:hypothetical protein
MAAGVRIENPGGQEIAKRQEAQGRTFFVFIFNSLFRLV